MHTATSSRPDSYADSMKRLLDGVENVYFIEQVLAPDGHLFRFGIYPASRFHKPEAAVSEIMQHAGRLSDISRIFHFDEDHSKPLEYFGVVIQEREFGVPIVAFVGLSREERAFVFDAILRRIWGLVIILVGHTIPRYYRSSRTRSTIRGIASPQRLFTYTSEISRNAFVVGLISIIFVFHFLAS